MTMKTPFDQAVRQHGQTVLRVCRAVLGATADADDAWSETFLAALKNWPSLDEGTNIEAWLVRVARRKAIDVTRARTRQAVPIDEPPETVSDVGNPGSDDDRIWETVAALPEKQRLAIAYHYLGGLPHAETAEIVSGTPAAVRRAAADGLKTLRRMRLAGERSNEQTKGAPR
jgi:RNA polymerase sigma factor (sigma-70 family)